MGRLGVEPLLNSSGIPRSSPASFSNGKSDGGPAKARVLVIGVYLADKPNNRRQITLELSSSTHYEVTQRWMALGRQPSTPSLCKITAESFPQLRPKVPLLNRLLSREDLSAFEFVMLIDDDISLPPQFVDRYLSIQTRSDFCLAQPARTSTSIIEHAVVEQRPGCLGRQTLFVESGQQDDWLDVLNRKSTEFQGAKWVFRVGGKMAPFHRVRKQGPARFENVLDTLVEERSLHGFRVAVWRHPNRSQMTDKIFGMTGMKMRGELDRLHALDITDQMLCGGAVPLDRGDG
jgi:hypothetical protein